MSRPAVPFWFNMFVSKLGCDSGLVLLWVTGWLEVAVALNSGITFSGSGAETSLAGAYP
jgi:hypothetical protein